MIDVVMFDDSPVLTGQKRTLILDGDAPFKVTNTCFVDSPPPPGFRPCAACGAVKIQANEPYDIRIDPVFWHGKTGAVVVFIEDAFGKTLRLEIGVLPDTDSSAGQMSAHR